MNFSGKRLLEVHPFHVYHIGRMHSFSSCYCTNDRQRQCFISSWMTNIYNSHISIVSPKIHIMFANEKPNRTDFTWARQTGLGHANVVITFSRTFSQRLCDWEQCPLSERHIVCIHWKQRSPISNHSMAFQCGLCVSFIWRTFCFWF